MSPLTSDPNDPRLGRGVGGEGMNEAYLVLSEEERAKGFVRPVRTAYKHVGRVICADTSVALERDPGEGRLWACSGQPGHEDEHDTWLPVGDHGERAAWRRRGEALDVHRRRARERARRHGSRTATRSAVSPWSGRVRFAWRDEADNWLAEQRRPTVARRVGRHVNAGSRAAWQTRRASPRLPRAWRNETSP